ncbi:MAG: DUF2219 family protein [Caulobacterales bacterium]|nr:DUF2219 family protein [Caulobacterales bacterium]
MRGFAYVGWAGAAIVAIVGVACPTLAQTPSSGPRTLEQALAGTAHVQPAYDIGRQAWAVDAQRDIVARLNAQSAFNIAADRPFGPAVEFENEFASEPSDLTAVTRRDIWREGEGFTDRLSLVTGGRLRRADGSPLPVTPLDQAELDPERYDVRFVRGWPVATAYTDNGLEVSLTPHAGVAVGSDGGSAEAGATVRIGSAEVRDGQAFGERARWYVYAAGSGRAVGYNFARTRDGDFARSGYSHDSGSFLGDASLGVAYRRGDLQGSFGLVYREIEAEGLRSGRGLDNDVTEGLVAFQLSIKPQW